MYCRCEFNHMKFNVNKNNAFNMFSGCVDQQNLEIPVDSLEKKIYACYPTQLCHLNHFQCYSRIAMKWWAKNSEQICKNYNIT